MAGALLRSSPAFVLIVLLTGANARAQVRLSDPVTTINQALDSYQQGAYTESFERLQPLTQTEILEARRISDDAIKSRDFRRAENLAILLLDMAIQVSAQRDSQSVTFRLASNRVVEELVAAGRRDPPVRAWFLLLDSFLEGDWNFHDLEPNLEAARTLFPSDSVIQVISGSFHETRARAPSRFVFTKTPSGEVFAYGERERHRDFETARMFFLEALRARPNDDEACLRLGRVAYELGRFDESIKVLGELTDAAAHSEETSYLATLFAAASYEALGRLDESKAAYLRAMAWPSQAPSVGLSALLWAVGDNRNSARVMDRLLANPPPDEIWQHYIKGQWRFLEQRRREARSLVR